MEYTLRPSSASTSSSSSSSSVPVTEVTHLKLFHSPSHLRLSQSYSHPHSHPHPHTPTMDFHITRTPHTFGLWFSGIATLIYASAVPGMLSIHNHLGALGWGIACVMCALWWCLLRQENKWRRMESLEVQTMGGGIGRPSIGGIEEPLMTSSSPSSSSSLHQHQQYYPSSPTNSRSSVAERSLVPSTSSILPSTQPIPGNFPWYLTTGSLALVHITCVLLLAFGIYLFIYAGLHSERLNGSSTWLGAIAFIGATKSGAQLAWRMRKMRRTYRSVLTYMEESYLSPTMP